MSHDAITAAQANAIYDVLAQHADAREDRRDEFIFHATNAALAGLYTAHEAAA